MKRIGSVLIGIMTIIGTWILPTSETAGAAPEERPYAMHAASSPTFLGPTGVAVDARGRIYVADRALATVYKLAPNGRLLGKIGRYPVRTSPPEYPFDVALDRQGNLYVAVSVSKAVSVSNSLNSNGPFHGRVQEFSPSGRLMAQFGTTRSALQPQTAYMTAVGPRGDVYVADPQQSVVLRFAPTGQPLNVVQPDDFPWGLAVDRHGNLYVSVPSLGRVVKYSPAGRQLRSIGGTAPGPRTLYPGGVAVDPHGNLYVIDQNAMRIEKFSSTGKLLTVWGGPGSRPGQFDFCTPPGERPFSLPNGLALGGKGNVYVVERCNARVQKFSPDGKLLAVFQ